MNHLPVLKKFRAELRRNRYTIKRSHFVSSIIKQIIRVFLKCIHARIFNTGNAILNILIQWVFLNVANFRFYSIIFNKKSESLSKGNFQK